MNEVHKGFVVPAVLKGTKAKLRWC